ncbi:MAG: pectate lyase, partial [Verrucomicrobiia bacterium]
MNFTKLTLLLAFALCGNHPLTAAIIGTNVSAQSLTARRIAALPAAQQPAWNKYLEHSVRQMQMDRAFLRAELKAHGLKESTAAPGGKSASSVPVNEPDAWYGQDEGRCIADVIVSYQTPAGGWSKNLDMAREVRPPGGHFAPNNSSRFLNSSDYDLPHDIGWSYVGTFDNDATSTELRYLAKTITAVGADHDATYRAAFLRGLDYIFAAQYPNGGWPQVWPLEGGYHDAITHNDNAMLNVLEFLYDLADGRNEFSFVPADKRTAAAASCKRGLDCIIATQIVVDGRRTVWCQQHDPLTLKPESGRNYEMPALTSAESADIMMFLMKLPNPGPEVVTAVHAAAAWFEKTQIRDVAFKNLGDEGRKLVPAPGNGPIWARYYEIDTDRPIFGDRDKTIHDDVNEISLERRRGYAWYRDTPELALQQYARWSQE